MQICQGHLLRTHPVRCNAVVLSYENIQEQVCLVCASVLRARHAGIVFISFDLPVSTVQVEYRKMGLEYEM